MSVSIGDITARLIFVDKGSSAVSQFTRNLDVSVKQIQLSGNRLTSALEGMLSKAALLATAGTIARGGFQFLKESTQEAMEAEKAFAQLRAGVESTGGAAGKSAEELSAMADSLSKLSGFDDELIAGGEAILLTFRRVRGEAFEQTMTLALDLSARFGKDIDSSVIMIAKALDTLMAGSARGLSALSKAGVTFTDQQKKTMEQLVKTGQAAKAETLFFAELEAQFGGSAEAARNTMGGALQALGVAWSNLKEEVGSGGLAMTGVIERITYVIETMTDGIKLFHLGFTLAFKTANDILGGVEVSLRRVLATTLEVAARLTNLNPLASDQQKLNAEIAASKARYNLERVRNDFAERSRRLEADAYKQVGAMLGILPKVQSKYTDIGIEIDKITSKQSKWFKDLERELAIQTQALDLFRQGIPVEQIENLVEAAEGLGKTNLLDPLVIKAAQLKEKIDAIATAFELAADAKQRLADAGDDFDKLLEAQIDRFVSGGDPEMDKLLANLRAQKLLVDSVATSEERRLRAVGEALALGIEGEALQRILLANADQWNVELSETQLLFNEIYERLGFIAEDIAFDLVGNWRRAWEENESITAATVDTLRDMLLDLLQDIISQWLSQWFRAMAAWLARWIATQRIAQASSAQTAAVSGASGAGGGLGSLFGMGQVASQGGGVSANTLAGWGLAAFALYVVYKGFIEDHERKFARVTISNGAIGTIESHGKKYLEGIQNAAESIVANLTKFLSDIDVEMERLGTVIIESSKAGWNVAIPGSTGKLFSSMEEAISYAQVLMLKYGEFAESVTLLVRSVIASTKAISIEQLASDIAFARELETQNLEQSAAAIRSAMDLAISQWKRAEDLFLSFYDRNLPAFAEAALSILTRLSNSIWAQYNQLAGIEEDPAKAWERKKSQYRVERQMVEAQLKLWKIEIEQRIANLKAGGAYLGGLGVVTKGTLKFAGALVQAAEVLDPALQELESILALINQTLAELPPVELPATDPNKGKGKGRGGRNRQELREDLREEVGRLEAEALGPLHGALYDLGQNISDFKDRAKEAKLPAAEIARGVELMTEAFQRSVQQQARDYAGLENEFTRRLREVEAFFAELQSLGAASGLTPEQIEALGGQALANLGTELSALINNFAGLVDPMAAINTKADELRAGVLAFAEAAGWSAEQIEEAIGTIEQGIEFQRQQGINSVLGNLFSMLKQFGLFQEDALEFERQNALLQLQVIEAQLRFYNALNEAAQEWIEGAREFINSDRFGAPPENTRTPVRVKVVDSDERDIFSDLFDSIRDAIDDWRSTIQDFVHATEELLTDEQLTGLTQQEQLDFARQRVDELVAKAKTGDLEALKLLDGARREFLKELRESEGGGFGFDVGFDWIMKETAELLANAQQGESDLIDKMLEGWSIPIHRMPDLLEGLDTTFYDQTNAIINAIYEAIGGVPSFATGGIVMSGPRLVRVAEYVPEAIVPLDRLMTAVPYTVPMQSTQSGIAQNDRWPSPESAMFSRDALARLSALESSNDRIAKSLESIKADIGSAVRRQ